MKSEKLRVKSEEFATAIEMLLKSVRQKNWGMLLCAALFTIHCSLFTSCRQEDDRTETVPARHWVEKTVAVVAPIGDAATKTRLERTAGWFLENFREAQMNDTLAIDLKIAWYDELSADLTALSQTLAADSTVIAVIGPFSNESVAEFAPACMKTQKPLIAPTATSEDVIRRYAVKSAGKNANKKPFLWSLTETDVEFTEVVMSAFATHSKYFESIVTGEGYEISEAKAAVFSPDNAYGMTFNYWAPFYAQQDGITLQRNQQYRTTAELLEQLSDYRPVMRQQKLARSAIFCNIETMEQMYEVVRANRRAIFEDDPLWASTMPSRDPDDPANDVEWQRIKNYYTTYFAFSGLSEEGLQALGQRAVGMLQGREGFSPYADPTTGFELAYKKRFQQLPTFAECKFYDALMLAAFAACYVEHRPTAAALRATLSSERNSSLFTLHSSFNQAIIAITIGAAAADVGVTAWQAEPMRVYLSDMERGRLIRFAGASGAITFDREAYTANTSTAYVHWQIMDGEILHRQYYGDIGGSTSDASAAWLYLYNEQQADADFRQQAEGDADIQYAPLTGQYAVLVQGTDGNSCYRHQADVLNVYQALRRGGFPDDHIILVIDAALASGSRYRGIVRAAPDGPDLLGGTDGLPRAQVDYDNADLTAGDIADILAGRQSEKLHTVVPQDEGQNVFFYWSGHGRSDEHGGENEFCWRDTNAGQGFTDTLLRQTAGQMKYRKLLIAAEPCYGEGVIRAVKGLPGVLAISGASANEQSWADNWSDEARVWMCDRFSLNLVTCLSDNPDTSFRDLFLYCAQHTLGSHAKIVNAANYGNLFTTGPAEFIRYNNK